MHDLGRPLERTFPVGDSAAIWVVNFRGQTRVSGWERPEVRVVAHARGEDAFGRPDGRWVRGLAMEQRDALFRLRAEAVQLPTPPAGPVPRAMDLEVKAPRESAVVVQSPNGLVVIEDLAGAVFVRTQSGSVSLRRVAGHILVLGDSSGCTGHWLRGEMAIRLTGGSLHLSESDLNRIEAETTTGGLDVQTALSPAGSYALRSRSGSLALAVPSASDASLDLRTDSGRIECLAGGERLFTDFGRPLLRMGRGNARVGLHTGSGDIQVSAWQWEFELPAPPMPEKGVFPDLPDDAPPELTALREVVQRRLTIAQALRQLAATPPAW